LFLSFLSLWSLQLGCHHGLDRYLVWRLHSLPGRPVLLRHVNLQTLLGAAGLETDLAMVLEHIGEVPTLHMVPHLATAVVAEDAAEGTSPLGVSRTLQAEGIEVIRQLGVSEAVSQACGHGGQRGTQGKLGWQQGGLARFIGYRCAYTSLCDKPGHF